jgi:hypothetical protein
MALGEPIKLRLSIERQHQYEEAAAARGMPLGTYLRQRLEEGDQVGEQLAELRRLIEDGSNEQHSPGNAGLSSAEAGMMVEMLLLLRSVVGGDKLQVAHGELRRQGLPVWTGQRP